MSQLSHAVHEIHHIDTLASKDQWVNQIHPLVKFILTSVYVTGTVSLGKYDIARVSGMAVYPLAVFILAELSLKDALKPLKIALPLILAIGIFNPFFDRVPVDIGFLRVNAGFLSMAVLVIKGILCVLASWLLIATTTIEKLCYAFRLLHIPRILSTQLLLTYRYLTLLLEEAGRMAQAYSLRAPSQKGIHVKVWGSFAGLLLLRSIDRAGAVYESMVLRGYHGEFHYIGENIHFRKQDLLYLAIWLGILLLFHQVPVLMITGALFNK